MKVLMMKLKKIKEIMISDFIMKKDSNNIIIGFYRIVLTIQESAMILHKAHLSSQRHSGKDLLHIIFLNPFYIIGQICITMLKSIQKIV